MTVTMALRIRLVIWTALVCWAASISSETLPYVPTTILPLSDSWAWENHTSRGLYILSPTDASVDLLFLNTSATLQASSLSPRTLTSGLPFAGHSSSSAFTASVADDGVLTVFAGDCSTPGSESIWTYGEVVSTASAPGWVKHTAAQSSTSSSTPGAPYFLGASLSFSSKIAPAMSAPVTYVYGGMCPWTNSSASTWQSAASYSNRMLKVSTDGSVYTTEAAADDGPPIAEAGFTLTALAPSITNRSGTVTQQISHVLLGGHTKDAFINMSTAAVWNLPEETWDIVYINPPAATYGNTELAIKAAAGTVDSRSGHSAVLNEDGTALVVLGGWVGDLTQAASPQLAILQIGSTLADWQWSIPELQPTGQGIYGHGAVLLPGNVMMVYGGYSISSTTARAVRKERRDSGQQHMFLNLTSLTWSDEYTNPTPSTTGSSSTSSSTSAGSAAASTSASSGSKPSGTNKLGLGLGLGLGIPLLLLLIALAIWFCRHRRRERLQRDEVVRGLAQDAGRFLSADDDEMAENNHFGSNWFPPAWNGTAAQDWYTGGGDPYARGSRSLGYETLRGAKSSNSNNQYPPPLPPINTASGSGLARSRSAARGLYIPAAGAVPTGGGAGYEFGGPGGSNAGIHPIYEAEDEDGEIAAAAAAAGAGGRSVSVSPEHPDENAAGASDPFATPPTATTPRGSGPTGGVYFPPPASRSSRTPSPEAVRGAPPLATAQAQDAEVQEWVTEVDAADAVLTARIGPHGGTTTTTTATTTTTTTARPQPRSRRNSLTAAPPPPSAVAAAAAEDEAGAAGRTGSNLSDSARSAFSFAAAAAGGGGGPRRTPSSSGSSSHTYTTARTQHGGGGTLAGLRDEGPSLLLGSPARGYSPEHRRGGGGGGGGGDGGDEDFGDDDDDESPPGSPSKSKFRRTWLGSLRRVFSGSPGSSSRGESPTHDAGPAGAGGAGSGSDYEPRLVGMGPGGRLLRRKQGKEAWGAQGRGEEGVEGEEDEDDWDVERAVEQRLVQIMFTVPKERLRVVNAEIEREEEAVVVVDPESEFEEGEEEYRGGGGGGGPEYEKLGHEEGAREEEKRDAGALEVPAEQRRPSTPMTPASLHFAEAVTMERPKTKVLQMVESIESLSRRGSPAGSPVKEQ